MEHIGSITGYIPRMVKHMAILWSKEEAQLKMKNKVLLLFSREASRYFEDRVQRLIRKHNNIQVIKEHIEIISVIYVNDELANVPASWHYSGLLIMEGSKYKPSCPAAKSAIVSVVEQERDWIVESLLKDSNSKRRALEIVFISHFRRRTNYGTVLTLQLLDRFGKQTNMCAEIEIDKVVEQKPPTNSIYTIEQYSPGTLLLLHENHGCIDFVAFCKNSNLIYFIQLSWEGYKANFSKAKEITTKRIAVRNSEKNSEYTMLHYYLKCFNSKKTDPKIPEEVKFLHISPLQEYYETSSNYATNEQVYFCSPNSLFQIDGWKLVKKSMPTLL